MKRFFRNAVAPAEEENAEEREPEPKITTWGPVHYVTDKDDRLIAIVDERKSEYVFESKEGGSKLIKTGKGRWVVIGRDGASYWRVPNQYGMQMSEVCDWLRRFTEATWPREVEEWAKSVTE